MNHILFISAFLGNMRGWQPIIILIVILLLFGGKKIPEIMRNLGRGAASFKQGIDEAKREYNRTLNETKKESKDSAQETDQEKK
jgi:sec-independent protein translocase protein TatA